MWMFTEEYLAITGITVWTLFVILVQIFREVLSPLSWQRYRNVHSDTGSVALCFWHQSISISSSRCFSEQLSGALRRAVDLG